MKNAWYHKSYLININVLMLVGPIATTFTLGVEPPILDQDSIWNIVGRNNPYTRSLLDA